MRLDKLKLKARKPIMADTAFTNAVVSFEGIFEELDSILVERTAEITALKYCLLSREHLMLEGSTGIAKSMLVTKFMERVKGFKLFSKQLTPTTQPDEIFGCMNSKTYREQAIWEYNTEGMMPEAHLAYLDEVYRGAKALLSNLFSQMNERVFYNGRKVVQCPLITTIGTTNFTTIDDELTAFHDRWLIRAKVTGLKSQQSRVTMLERSLNHKPKAEAGFSLDELRLLQSAIGSVKIDATILEIYDELVAKVANRTSYPVSDRRLVQALKLAQCAYIMDANRPREFSESYLSEVKYGIIEVGNVEHESAFMDIYTKLIGERIQSRQVSVKLNRIKAKVVAMEADYDPKMPVEDLKLMFVQLRKIQSGLASASTVELGNSTANRNLASDIISQAERLLVDVEPAVNKLVFEEVEAELAD